MSETNGDIAIVYHELNETTEKLDALTKIVDDVIRKRPEGGV